MVSRWLRDVKDNMFATLLGYPKRKYCCFSGSGGGNIIASSAGQTFMLMCHEVLNFKTTVLYLTTLAI